MGSGRVVPLRVPRRRIRHYLRDMREDMGYALFVYDAQSDALVGGLTLCNVRQGVTQSTRTLGYWVRSNLQAGLHDGRGSRDRAVCLRLARIAPPRGGVSADEYGIHAPSGTGRVQARGARAPLLRINGEWRDHVLYALLETDPWLGERRVIVATHGSAGALEAPRQDAQRQDGPRSGGGAAPARLRSPRCCSRCWLRAGRHCGRDRGHPCRPGRSQG